MASGDFGSLVFALFLLLVTAHVLGSAFARLHQPRVIGEIAAGVLLGPHVLGSLAPVASHAVFARGESHGAVLEFLYMLGLLLLMFFSGAETRNLFNREDRREIAWLAGMGSCLPFLLALAAAQLVPLEELAGANGGDVALVLVFGIAAAVTSIPVLSRIFHDLGVLHTRFARVVLGMAVIEDVVLWVVLAIATALAASAALPAWELAAHLGATVVYFGVGVSVAVPLLARLGAARWNVLAASAPLGFVTAVLLAYAAVAAFLDVSVVFAAFLAGLGMGGQVKRFGEAFDALGKVSFTVFIPIYFAIVGYRLDLAHGFSLALLGAFLFGTCAVKLLSVGLGARLAGFRGLDVVNLAIAANARGGPGIVLASVAFDAGIINGAFHTALVIVAVLTSQASGAWLAFVLRRGWPLLRPGSPDAGGRRVEEQPHRSRSAHEGNTPG
jgi:Kef-type K+ transport system membrane component KefB